MAAAMMEDLGISKTYVILVMIIVYLEIMVTHIIARDLKYIIQNASETNKKCLPPACLDEDI